MRSAFGVEHISKRLPKGMKRLRLKRVDEYGAVTITASRRKKKLGEMWLHNAPGKEWHGQIHYLNVKPEHQRKGLATAMYQHAQRTGAQPAHHSIRTEAGDAWAKAVGGKLPKRVDL